MDRLIGPRAKICRAKRHIDELKPLVERFLAKNPYEVIEYKDAETGANRAKVKISANPDPLWGLIIGDAIHNLRSALDLLYCQLLDKRSGSTEYGDFQILDSKTNFDGRARPIAKRIGTEAWEVLRDVVQPYRGGNNALWCLHKLDLVDKHRLLLVVGHSNPSLIVSVVDEQGNELLSHSYPTTSPWPLKDGDDIPAGTHLGSASEGENPPKTQMHFKVAFDITLYEPKIIGIPEPLALSLANMTSAVEYTVDSFAAILAA